MLRNYQLFIDCICSKACLSALETVNQSEASFYTFRIRHLEELQLPDCKHDLVIYDLKGAALASHIMQVLVEHYEEVLFINAPADHAFYEAAAALNIHYILREPYWPFDFESLFMTYLKFKTAELEHSIYMELFSSAQNSIVMTDVNGHILFANPYFEEIAGYTLDELLHKSPGMLKSHYHDIEFYTRLWNTIQGGNVWEGIFINRSKDGELFYEEATITPVRNGHGDVERYLKIGKNITRERLLLDQLSEEVKLARSVIDTLLPKFYQDEKIDFSYDMMHYNEIGGDFIYFSNATSTQYHFALIDVIGHGVSSALVALTLTQMFRDYIRFLDLNQTVRSINQLLTRLNAENGDRGIYVTGVFIEIDFKLHNYQIINAGHPDVLLLMEDQTIRHAESTNVLLGVEDQREYHIHTGSLYEVSKFLCYTDGLYESNHISYDTALTILEESLSHLSNQFFYESVLHAFLKRAQVEDDITICKIEIKK
ncbi:SpoIIE family protein phosphatase [Fusibacter paucivorans]|uniref:SpoIIE family protein phosphatase n=1 Tax=Fusibacter paucivorans TaxID=76009 RepID=A0ABS5PLN3_9FIRM|nr:SpoIIE family protein phosphatase [Fusibacter paucivorans]MBS7526048.1 SpoIIE family protein phosphatase [Fusibacter paucivorans]